MVFFCQRKCYERKFLTKVVSCHPSKTEDVVDGKKVKINCYEVTFEDTVFFPEGGGQPFDKGDVNGISVIKVLRKGGDAIHYLSEAVEVGSEAHQSIDWIRRFDHMQQHSAQHLITAVADQEFSFATLSWNLGEKICSIELNTPKITNDQIEHLEKTVNALIRKSLPVTIDEYDSTDPKLNEVRTRGLPEDVVGPVRVVTIKDVESNMCCGTHVSNLMELQAVKILYTEKGKANKMLIYFLAGDRTLNYLGECIARERDLNILLHSNAQDHVRLVEKCKKDLKQCTKSLTEALRDLAVAEAFKFNSSSPKPKVFFHHRRDGDFEYLGTIISSINDDSVLKVLSAGEDNGPGILIMQGPQDDINAISSKVCEILEGKGGGKVRFTAKVTKLGKRKDMEMYVREKLDYPLIQN